MIYTSYFQKQISKNDKDTVYASIAVGKPKMDFEFKLEDAYVLKPFGIFGKNLTDEEYKRLYLERLDRIGVDKIRRVLREIQGDKKNLILMCFERNREECHRSWFAEWWQEKTGEIIEEYGSERKKTVKQLSIFDFV